jgi:transcriptional regulator with XRE-family HTH domain
VRYEVVERKKVLRGERLRLAREWRGLTQDELAARVGAGQSQMNKYENNKNDPTADVLVRLSSELEVSVDWLLGLVDEPNGHVAIQPPPADEYKYLLARRAGDFKKIIQMALDESDK